MEDNNKSNGLFSFIQQRYIFTGIGILLAILALLIPFKDIADPVTYMGGLLIWAAILEILHGFRRSESQARLSAWFSGGITLLIGTLLINNLLFQTEPLVQFILLLFLIDGIRYFYIFLKNKKSGKPSTKYLLSGIGNILALLIILFFRHKNIDWVVALVGFLRILGTIYNLFTSKMGVLENVAEDVIKSMGLEEDSELAALAEELEQEDAIRAPIDKSWIITFLFILFFIHLGRMGFDRSTFGILSPVVAVIGDMFIALVVAFAIIAPFRWIFRKFSGLFLNGLYHWVNKVPEDEWRKFSPRRLAKRWIKHDLGLSISIRKSGYSFSAAIRNGLKIGLPFAALLAAIMPVLGMSWYFDTENWASGVWDGYAGNRTEVWREEIIAASGEKTGPNAFKLNPEGMNQTGDFSFVVIGDPGEGDPSQLILKDQILEVSNKNDISFVVISSDIVYPSGAMRDYERKFFLPFKGLKKPMYSIPGNHDWYDALDGYTATFFTPDAAKKAMEARMRSDGLFTTTSPEVIDQLVNQAAYLRKEYQLPVGYQNAPFFQVSNDHFVFLAIDTGVRRKVDDKQLAWIKSVLEASKDKYVMALLGHPFYAIGEYQGDMNPDFRALHDLLRAYKVPLIMAGDTHDLEYYIEPPQNNDGHTMHHFVNGGGGAYLSIGAAMADPETRPTADWANYPAREPLISKIDSLTPSWKYPAWVWVKEYDGYPFSAEWLSAAFDYNQAPYFQSFMEIKVEKSQNRIRLIPYGINGQLRWSDFDFDGKSKPAGAKRNDLVEWILPMNY
ncbi:metallophosphoesterase [Namhaeicola litoreus]|uniref:Metallophosphoesterase n=1 Tax=Namhaeicola litoreus TaxID=1052145 RepID=A0ABW3XYV1_9FLAO